MRSSPAAQAYWAYATLGARLGAGPVHVPALDHGDAVVAEPQHDPPQRHDPAGVLASCSACSRCSGGSRSPPAPSRSGSTASPTRSWSIPQLFEDSFPAWFAGVAFAAIAIGALVPAAIMSIAAANTFTRNIYKEWIKPDATPAQEAKVSKIASLRGEGVRAGLRPDAGQAERHQLPAARRHLDPADVPRHRLRPLHPVVPPVGAARRLGGRHDLRHRAAWNVANPATAQALRRLARPIPGVGRWATSP